MDFTKVEFVFKSTRILWEIHNFKLLAKNYFWKEVFPVISYQQIGDRLKVTMSGQNPACSLIKDLTESQNKLTMFVKTMSQMEFR